MKSAQLKFNLIDKLITLHDTALLHKVEKLLSKIQVDTSETYHLSAGQLKMIKASEEDIKQGRLISNEKLNAEEDKWLNK